MKEPIKVLVAIPNMGYTQCEAYGNRLMNFMVMGNYQTERQVFAQFDDVLREKCPEKADEILNAYIEKNGRHVKKIGEELFQFYFVSIGRIFTPAARDQAAQKAVEHGMDLLYFIDDDMICPNDMFERLYKSMQQSGADIICPLAFTRNPPYNPVLYASIDGWDPINKTDYFINNVVMNYPRQKIVEADACGFGAALIKTWLFDKIEKPWFMCSSGTGEDILFCYKAKKAHGRVFMDTTFNIGHLSHPSIITEMFVDDHRAKTDPNAAKRYPEFSKYEALTIIGD